MTSTLTSRTYRRASSAAIAVTLIGMLVAESIGASTGRGAVETTDTVAVTAMTLAGTPAAQEFAAMLPLTLELSDAWGQAKAGPLPHPVSVEGVARTLSPVPGGIYYWPDTATLAVYYDDLGQSVPPPGLIQLGVVEAGMDQFAGAGRKVRVQFNPATTSPS
jgi:hypothetical protein